MRLFLIIALSLAAALVPTLASAQTCRVKCGGNTGSRPTYKEVYEYDFVDEKPCFPGGQCKLLTFINRERKYPDKAYKAGIQGRVICSFVVNCDGSVTNICVIKGVEASLNAEATRILSIMPDWTPGRLDGQPVPVRVLYPVPFRK